MEGRVRVGVVGLGVWCQNHALAYSDSPMRSTACLW